ncbi:MAG: prolyl oligopeptidase family serine peptidase [bacterium]
MRKRFFLPIVLLLVCGANSAENFTIEALFNHPYIVGHHPENPLWSPDGKRLAFLWNAEGNRFRDLYLYDLSGKITRLTDLQDLPRSELEKDERSDWQKAEEAVLDGGLSNPFWSQDGKRILFEFRGDLFSIAAQTGAEPIRLLQTEAGEGNASLSKDGGWIAYTCQNDVFVRESATGRIVQITRDGSEDVHNGTGAYDTYLSGVFWAPDSRKFAFVQDDITGFDRLLIPDYTTPRVTTQKQQREIAGGKLPLTKLGVANPDSAYKAPFWIKLPPEEQYYLRSLDWSPDAQKLLLEVMPRDMFSRLILIADAVSGVVDTLWVETDSCWIPRNMATVRFGPDGKSVIFASERSGWCHLYELPLDSGVIEPKALTSGNWEIAGDWTISEDRRVLLFLSNEDHPTEKHLYRITLPAKKKQRITAETGWIQGFEPSRDGSRAALIYADLENPFDLYWCNTNTERPIQRITVSPTEDFQHYDWFKPQYVSIPTADGQQFPAKLWLPAPNRLPAPLVVYIHGAGYHQNVDKAPWGYEDRFHRLLVQEGFAVVDIDYRGSAGYGRDWRVAIYRHTGGKDLDDAVDAAQYCVKQGWADSERIGIWGWSYGGFLTNMAMFQRPDVFKVGCSVAAVNDWKNYNLEYTTQRFHNPEDDSEAYYQSSPISFAEGLHGKLLIIHGLQDDNVHAQDTIQLVDKLIRLGKDFDLLIYPREDHGFARDESNVHVMRAILQYFQTHL